MGRKQGAGGRFVVSSSGKRIISKTFRLTLDSAKKLDQLRTSMGNISIADLIDLWIQRGCPLSSSSNLDTNIAKENALSKFKREVMVAEQSSEYKIARKAIELFIKEISESL